MGILSLIKKKTDDTSPEDKNNTHTDLKSHILNNKKDTEQNLEKAKEEIKKKMQKMNNTNKDKTEKETKSKSTEQTLEKAKEEIKKKMQEKEQKKKPDPSTQTQKTSGDSGGETEKSKNATQKKDAAQSANNNQKTKETKDQKKHKKNTKKATSKTEKKDENKKTEKEATKNGDNKKVAVSSILNKIGNQRDIDISGGTVVETYNLNADNVYATVTIYNVPNQYIPIYYMKHPVVTIGTLAILNAIREQLIMLVQITTKEFVDPSALGIVKEKFMKKAYDLLDRYLPSVSEKEKKTLAGNLIHEMLGLGDIELLLSDPYLEEIVINSHKDPIWVYHKHHGWLKTNIFTKSEDKIYNYSSSIGRRVGRQITNLNPLMDAHLSTGDRVNATLFPISTNGNTITIRKFSRSPWTIIHFLEVKTLTREVAALLWLAIQYELNILVAGGTASGKTSMLNILMPFMPPNQRIISIEDTREINLPKFLHWVPFSSREANPEGKGQVTMLDLLANSLRMRPDRIIIGEIRRSKEAEVMFEAIRTGHSAYATFHGDKAEEVQKRLTNPPINLPKSSLSALHLIVVQYRHRRKGVRRTLEVAEVIKAEGEDCLNLIYQWNARTDTLDKVNKSYRIYKEIQLYTGMSNEEIDADLANKAKILEWMTKYQIKTINTVGKVFAEYYRDENTVVKLAKAGTSPKELLGPELYSEIAPAQKPSTKPEHSDNQKTHE
ncbi:MAG: type II/IV secretion system ATPase subunit [Candidatus Aenigmarchaeota archaeon]|nr:type II/IV secretion system ATPase subunit [Candidatus Aenigmarchaeota archaeon]